MSPYVPAIIPESDRAYFDTSESAPRIGWGDQPALLLVDLTAAFVEERPEVTGQCVEHAATLLSKARQAEIPIVHTIPREPGTYPQSYPKPTKGAISHETNTDQSDWLSKIDEIVAELEPEPSEHVIDRPRASAFFDTHLANLLHHDDIDTIIVAGMTTSGCVRATVTDGYASNFRMIVPPSCVADRSKISHEVSLFDLDMKYADVEPLQTVLERLEDYADEPE